MDFIQTLRWSLEEVARAYGVPKPLLSDLERATFANINAAERIFWRNTIVPQLHLLAEQLNHHLLPQLGYPNLQIHFDLTSIEALQEDQNKRVHGKSSSSTAASSPSTNSAKTTTSPPSPGATSPPSPTPIPPPLHPNPPPNNPTSPLNSPIPM